MVNKHALFIEHHHTTTHRSASTCSASGNEESGSGSTYKPPDLSLMGKKLKMRFKVNGKIQWFEGQITNYDGLTGKYGVYFPIDKETIYIFPNDKDVSFL